MREVVFVAFTGLPLASPSRAQDVQGLPLVLVDPEGKESGAVVSAQGFVTAGASLSLYDRLLIALDMPFAVRQSGDNPARRGGVGLVLLDDTFQVGPELFGRYLVDARNPSKDRAQESPARAR